MRFLLFAFVLFILSGSDVYAQNSGQNFSIVNPTYLIKRQYNNRLAYKRLANKARNYDRRNEFPFEQMVYAYAGGPDYDPYGKETIGMLTKLAFDVENEQDTNLLEEKYQQFNNIVNDHLGNFGVVNAAISLIRQNKSLGDIKFLQWIKSGLIERLLRSGKGYNPASAYRIISMEEENFLLVSKNLELVDREYFSTGSQFYHINRTLHRETGSPELFFTNIATVISREIINKKIEDPFYNYTPKIPDDY